MAVTIGSGQEMKLTIVSGSSEGTRNKTLRYINPLADNTTDAKCTVLTRALMNNSQNTYSATKGSIELGYLNEE